jgi:hypothetical protein
VKLGPDTANLYGRNRITANVQDTKLAVETDTDSTKFLNAEDNLWFVYTSFDSLLTAGGSIRGRFSQHPIAPNPAIDFDPFYAADTLGYCGENPSRPGRQPHTSSMDGSESLHARDLDLPTHLELGKPFPNPGMTGVEIVLAVPVDRLGVYSLAIFDVHGRRVSEKSEPIPSAGRYTLGWKGRDDSDRVVAAGVYFLRVSGPGDFHEIRRIVWVR